MNKEIEIYDRWSENLEGSIIEVDESVDVKEPDESKDIEIPEIEGMSYDNIFVDGKDKIELNTDRKIEFENNGRIDIDNTVKANVIVDEVHGETFNNLTTNTSGTVALVDRREYDFVGETTIEDYSKSLVVEEVTGNELGLGKYNKDTKEYETAIISKIGEEKDFSIVTGNTSTNKNGIVTVNTIEGHTLHNLCDAGEGTNVLQKDINEKNDDGKLSLTGTYLDGSLETKIKGRTLLNLGTRAIPKTIISSDEASRQFGFKSLKPFKTGQVYTVYVELGSYTGSKRVKFAQWLNDGSVFYESNDAISNSMGVNVFKITPTQEYKDIFVYFDLDKENVSTVTITEYLVLEGDYTEKMPSYFKGVINSGEGEQNLEFVSLKEGVNLLRNSSYLDSILDWKVYYSDIQVVDDNFSSSKKALKCTSKGGGNGGGIFQNKITLGVENKKYTLSGWFKGKKGTNIETGFERHKTKTVTLEKDDTWQYFEITSDLNPTNWNRTIICYGKNCIDIPFYMCKLKLEVGEKATAYIPSIKDSYFNSMQNKTRKSLKYYDNNGKLLPIPSLGKWDTIQLHENGKYYWHKKTGKFVFNELQNYQRWSPDPNESKTIKFAVKDLPIKIPSVFNRIENLVADVVGIPMENPNDFRLLDKEGVIYWDKNVSLAVSINRNKLISPDIEGFKQYVKTNPITAVYELEEEELYECENLDCPTYSSETSIVAMSGALNFGLEVKNKKYKVNNLEPNTQYTVDISIDLYGSSSDLTVNLGGAEVIVPSWQIKEREKISITTPEVLSDSYLRVKGERLKIGSILVIKGDTALDEYSYFKGMESSFECNKTFKHPTEPDVSLPTIKGVAVSTGQSEEQLTLHELYGGCYQDPNNLKEIISVGELQEDGQYKVDFIACGKNLLDKSWFEIGKISTSDGTDLVDDNAIRTNKFIKIEKDYIATRFDGGVGVKLLHYDEDKKFLGYTAWGTGKYKNTDISTYVGTKYIKIVFENTNNINIDSSFEIYEVNNPPTSYNPYEEVKSSITIPNQLQKIGNLSDRLYFDKEENSWCIEKQINTFNTANIEKENLVNLEFGNKNTVRFGIPISVLGVEYVDTSNGKDTMLVENLNFGQIFDKDESGFYRNKENSGSFYIRLPKNNIADINSLLRFLKETPFNIYYQSGKPQKIVLSKEQQMLLNTIVPKSHISVDSKTNCELSVYQNKDIPMIELQGTGKNIVSCKLVLGDIDQTNGVSNLAGSGHAISSDFIKCKPNTEYLWSYTLVTSSKWGVIFEYDSNKQFLGYRGSDGGYFRTKHDTRFLKFKIEGKDNINIKDVQMEEGKVKTPYETYKTSTCKIPLVEPLRSLGNVKDKLIFEGDRIRVERNIKQDGLILSVIPTIHEDINYYYHNGRMEVGIFRNGCLSQASNVHSKISAKFYEGEKVYFSVPEKLKATDKLYWDYNKKYHCLRKNETTIDIPTMNKRISFNSFGTPTNIIFTDNDKVKATNIKAESPMYKITTPVLKPNTLYNVQLECEGTTTNVEMDLNGSKAPLTTVKEVPLATDGFSRYSVGITTENILNNQLKIYGAGNKVRNVMLFEGLLPQMPDYFEGVESLGQKVEGRENINLYLEGYEDKERVVIDTTSYYSSNDGAIVIDNIEGETRLNQVLNGKQVLNLNDKINLNSDKSFITCSNTVNKGYVDVKLKGKTLVNLAPKYEIRYKAEADYDGFAPLLQSYSTEERRKGFVLQDLKPSTVYTLMFYVNVMSIGDGTFLMNNPSYNSVFEKRVELTKDSYGWNTVKLTSRDVIDETVHVALRTQNGTGRGDIYIGQIVLLEGDYTNIPISYFEGLMNSGEDVETIDVLSLPPNQNLLINSDFRLTATKDKFADYNSIKCKLEGINPQVLIGKTLTLSFFVSTKGEGFVPNPSQSSETRNRFGMHATIRFEDSTGVKPPKTHYCLVKTDNYNITEQRVSVTDTIPLPVGYDRIRRFELSFQPFTKPTPDNNETWVFGYPKLEIGSTATDWTPNYSEDIESKYYNKKQLKYYDSNKNLIPVPSLGEWDTIEKHSDGKYYYHQRSPQLVLNGSENWSKENADLDSTVLFNITVDNSMGVGTTSSIANLLSDKFATVISGTGGTWGTDKEGISINPAKKLHIRILKSRLETPDVDGFKKWLQANNVTVVYQSSKEEIYECASFTLETYAPETNIVLNSGAIWSSLSVKNTGYGISPKLLPSMKYTVVSSANKDGLICDINGQEVSLVNGRALVTTSTVLTDSPIRFYGKGGVLGEVLLLQGDFLNKEVKYFDGLLSSFEENKTENGCNVKISYEGENLLSHDFFEVVDGWNRKDIYTKDGWVVLENSNMNKEHLCVFTRKVKVKPNTTYTYSFVSKHDDLCLKVEGYAYEQYYEDMGHHDFNTPWQVFGKKEKEEKVLYRTFTTSPYAKNIVLRVCHDGSRTGERSVAYFKDFKFYEGEFKEKYEPYKVNSLEIGLQEPLRGIEDKKDRLVFKNGVLFIERNIGLVKLVGDEPWYENARLDNTTLFTLEKENAIKDTNKVNCLSVDYPSAPSSYVWSTDEEGVCVGSYEKPIRVRIRYSRLETKDSNGFKKWLQSNPITLYYKFENPVYEEVPYEKSKIILDGYKKGTIKIESIITPKTTFDFLSNGSAEDFVLPSKLSKIGNVADKLYWDKTKGHYCIEKNIENSIVLDSPQVIDLTGYNKPLHLDILDKNMNLDSYGGCISPSKVKLKSLHKVFENINIKPNTKYTIQVNIDKSKSTVDKVYVGLGGSITEFNLVEGKSCYQVTIITPYVLDNQNLILFGNKVVADKIMLLEGEIKQELEYFTGLRVAGVYDEVNNCYNYETYAHGQVQETSSFGFDVGVEHDSNCCMDIKSLEGNTITNYWGRLNDDFNKKFHVSINEPTAQSVLPYVEDGYVVMEGCNSFVSCMPWLTAYPIKAKTEYTTIVDVAYNSLTNTFPVNVEWKDESAFSGWIEVKGGETGIFKYKRTSKENLSTVKHTIRTQLQNFTPFGEKIKFRVMILEGDWTNKPLPKYFEGTQSIGYKTKNLVHSQETVTGLIDKYDGAIMTGGSYDRFISTKEFIEVEPDTKYIPSCRIREQILNPRMFVFDENKKIIQDKTDGFIITNPNAKYMRLSIDLGSNVAFKDEALLQLEWGDKISPYEENFSGYYLGIGNATEKLKMYLNEPLRRVGGASDKLMVKDHKLVIERNVDKDLKVINAVYEDAPIKLDTDRFKFKCAGDEKVEIDSLIPTTINVNALLDYDSKMIKTPEPLQKGSRFAFNESKGHYCIVKNDGEVDLSDYTQLIKLKTPRVKLKLTTGSGSAKPVVKSIVPIKKAIVPSAPDNLRLAFEKDKATLTWNESRGATHYNVYLDGELLETVETNMYETHEELCGYLTVKAYNIIHESQLSEDLYVKTIPNEPHNLTAQFSPSLDGYDFEVSFIDKSEIETSYRLEYQVDNGHTYKRNVEASDGSNKVLTVRFTSPEIEDNIIIRVIAVNEIGENDLTEPMTLLMSPTPRWTYDREGKGVVLSWFNRTADVDSYIVRYSIEQNVHVHKTVVVEDQAIGAEVRTFIPLEDTKTMKVCVASVVGQQQHLFCKELDVSKKLDHTLIAPSGFSYDWLGRGRVCFSWTDDYTCENGFEFEYSINEGKPQTVFIESTTVERTGTLYSFTHTFEDLGAITGRVRMKWDLGVSDYTNFMTANYIPVSGLPPKYISKKFTEEGLKIEWEGQDYVEKYVLHYVENGVVRTYETIDNFYTLNVDYDINNNIQLYVITHFVGGVISEKSPIITFVPTKEVKYVQTIIFKGTQEKYFCNVICHSLDIKENYEMHTKSISDYKKNYDINTMVLNMFTLSYHTLETFTWGKGSSIKYNVNTSVSDINVVQGMYNIATTSFTPTDYNIPVDVTIITPYILGYPVGTEINKVRIVTIGDSITAGHPNFWAETMTGNEKSQYQYWLNRRLKGAYEIINKGYGSDTTDKILARFKRDVLPCNGQYCIIQGGTNDLYWAMAENDGDQVALDRKMEVMKANIREMIKICWDNHIVPIVGTLIPRTGATGIYKTALYDFNDWIVKYCTQNENIYYIDFFNAGKDNVPPTPLEDPQNAGALNPMYDGDAIYDEYGNLIKQGRGIHPSPEGYKIMGDCIPLNIFKTNVSGLKLYLDENCTMEERLDETDKLRPYYSVKIDNIRRGKKKTIVRYVKNIGVNQSLFAMYYSNTHNLTVWFADENGNKGEYANGLLAPNRVAKVIIEMMVQDEDSKSNLNLHLVGREFKQG